MQFAICDPIHSNDYYNEMLLTANLSICRGCLAESVPSGDDVQIRLSRLSSFLVSAITVGVANSTVDASHEHTSWVVRVTSGDPHFGKHQLPTWHRPYSQEEPLAIMRPSAISRPFGFFTNLVQNSQESYW